MKPSFTVPTLPTAPVTTTQTQGMDADFTKATMRHNTVQGQVPVAAPVTPTLPGMTEQKGKGKGQGQGQGVSEYVQNYGPPGKLVSEAAKNDWKNADGTPMQGRGAKAAVAAFMQQQQAQQPPIAPVAPPSVGQPALPVQPIAQPVTPQPVTQPVLPPAGTVIQGPY